MDLGLMIYTQVISVISIKCVMVIISSMSYLTLPIIPLNLDECQSKKCGELCNKESEEYAGICDGGGFCDLSGAYPCFEEGCDGKQCGDQCLSGGILAHCNQFGECVDLDSVICGN